jgi:hypothetical protein
MRDEPPHQIIGPRGFAIEQKSLALIDDEHIVQKLALRGQEDGVKRLARDAGVHIIADKPLQKGAPVGPAEAQNPAIW